MATDKKIKIVKLKPDEFIEYSWKHSSYGRAEFDICPVFKYGKLKKMLIYPRQQETDVGCYEIDCYNQTTFTISSWTHKGIENPWAWRYFFCKEHKQLEMSVYVPPMTNKITIRQGSDFGLIFEHDDAKRGKKE